MARILSELISASSAVRSKKSMTEPGVGRRPVNGSNRSAGIVHRTGRRIFAHRLVQFAKRFFIGVHFAVGGGPAGDEPIALRIIQTDAGGGAAR